MLVGAVERDTNPRGRLTTLGLTHRTGTNAAATDGTATTHEKLLQRDVPAGKPVARAAEHTQRRARARPCGRRIAML